MSKQNTRKLIEGLYRQKFNAKTEFENLTDQVVTAKKGRKTATTIEVLEVRQREAFERELMIDELLIEFFGE